MFHLIYGGFRQETNTFSPLTCKKENFMARGTCFGRDILKLAGGRDHSAGMLDHLLSCEDVEFTPVAEYSAASYGRVEQAVADEFIGLMVEAIEKAKALGKLDGVFLSLHGGMALTEEDDGIGYILEKIRAAAGENIVITASSDLHANITRKVMANVDTICGFHEYPHIDAYETGVRAAKFGMEMLRTKKRPHIVCVKIPMILQAEASNTLIKPLKNLLDYARSLEAQGKVRDFTIYHLQPWFDCKEASASVVVIADTLEAAEKYASDLAARYYEYRHILKYEPLSVDEGLDKVLEQRGKKLVVLSDASDNTSGGAAGDSVVVLRRILERDLDIKGAVCVADPEVAEQAIELGEGAEAEFTVGGKLDPKFQKPITFRGTVYKICDPLVKEHAGKDEGKTVSFGKAVLLKVKNMFVLVCQYPQYNYSPSQFTAFGIDLKDMDMILVKSSLAYRELCEPLTDEMYNVLTPGSTSSDLPSLGFENIPRPMFPFDKTDDFGPAAPYEGRSALGDFT